MNFRPVSEIVDRSVNYRTILKEGILVTKRMSGKHRDGTQRVSVSIRMSSKVLQSCRFAIGDRLTMDFDAESGLVRLRQKTDMDNMHWKLTGGTVSNCSALVKITWYKGMLDFDKSYEPDYKAEINSLIFPKNNRLDSNGQPKNPTHSLI
mgnify:CR=1 FL=1